MIGSSKPCIILNMKSNTPAQADLQPDPDSAPRWVGRSGSKRSRRDAILHSVGAILRESRLSTLTMTDIAEALGITKGNLYYYFRDKQDILYQCHMRCMALSLAALQDVQSRRDELLDPLHLLLIAHIEGMASSPFGGVLLADVDALSAVQRRHYVARRDEFEAGVRDLIQHGVERGLYHCEDDRIASLAILGAINWLPRWYHPDGRLSASQVAQAMADFLMRALWVEPSRAGR
jgi:AcrR family transcriptional regulator